MSSRKYISGSQRGGGSAKDICEAGFIDVDPHQLPNHRDAATLRPSVLLFSVPQPAAYIAPRLLKARETSVR